jgi:hypothetical protein
MIIELTEDDINLMRIIAQAPWIDANPLMSKIGQQMAKQVPQGGNAQPPSDWPEANRPNKQGH